MPTLEHNNQNIILNHNPNSFFYTSAQTYNDMSNNSIAIENNCSVIGDSTWDDSTWDDKCNSTNFPDNSSDCLKVSNCKNYYETKELYGKRNNYSASGQLYLDNSQDYKKSMIDSINLTVSSAFLVYVIINKALE